MFRLGPVQVRVLCPDDGVIHGALEVRRKGVAIQMQSRCAAALGQLTAHLRFPDLLALQKPCCRPVILLQDRQQQVAGIGFFAAKIPGKLHRTAQQLIRLVRKALVPAKAKFFPNTHLPAPC